MIPAEAGRSRRGSLGLPLLVVVLAGLAIAGYLSAVRLFGEAPACGPSRGCETVQASEYSVLLGVLPVAYLGFAFMVLVAALAAWWWRRADRWALVAAYGLLVLGTLFAGYLTYLELFEIRAICPWCVAFAVCVLAGAVIAAIATARSSAAA